MKNLETLFLGQHLIHLQDVDSTNNFAANLIKQTKVVNGTVILADNQFSGRGQTGNKWQSQDGKNLTFSLILQPRIQAKDQFLISKITCLAIIETLKDYQIEATIKWPNDILIAKRKISGILIENTLQGKDVSNSIIGIGINVNQVFQGQDNAVSILELTGKESDRIELLRSYLHKMEKWYLLIENGKIPQINDSYLKSLFGLEKKVQFLEKEAEFEATIKGVNELGQLILELEDGKIRLFNNQEIRFVL